MLVFGGFIMNFQWLSPSISPLSRQHSETLKKKNLNKDFLWVTRNAGPNLRIGGFGDSY